MIERYARDEMAARFSEQARMDTWLLVEQVALRAMATEGIAPQIAADALSALSCVDVARVKKRELVTRHDLAAFVDTVADVTPAAAGWVHFGLTSTDIVDTAQAITLRDATAQILSNLEKLALSVSKRAFEHRESVMLGRTHGMPAEVTSFGAKLAGWWHQLQRDHRRITTAMQEIAVGKLSGAVGTYSGLGPSIERRVLAELDLRRDPSATQIVQRDRHAELLGSLAIHAGTLERFALEIRHLQRAEVGEVGEPFADGQKGSSAMPHKRNPIVSEQVCGLARLVRANAGASLENIALWHERDISHSSIERIILPDTFLVVDYLQGRVTWLIEGLYVDKERMLSNIRTQRGAVASQRVLLHLVAAGMVRDSAYRIVQGAASSLDLNADSTLCDLLAANEDVLACVTIDTLRELCDPAWVPDGINAIFDELASLA